MKDILQANHGASFAVARSGLTPMRPWELYRLGPEVAAEPEPGQDKPGLEKHWLGCYQYKWQAQQSRVLAITNWNTSPQ